MNRRAAIIITDFGRIVWDAADLHPRGPWETDTSEQLLADLRDAVDCIWGEVSRARSSDDDDPEPMRLARVAQRLKELLPKEES